MFGDFGHPVAQTIGKMSNLREIYVPLLYMQMKGHCELHMVGKKSATEPLVTASSQKHGTNYCSIKCSDLSFLTLRFLYLNGHTTC